MVQDHLFPNDGGLSDSFQRLVLSLSEIVQGLFKSPSRSSQSLLSLLIVRVASCVDFVSAGTEIISGEELCGTRQQTSSESDCLRGGDTKLASGGLVGVRCPRSRFRARNVLWEGLGDNRSMSRSVDLGDDVNAALKVQGVNNVERRHGGRVVHLASILDDICDLGRSIDLVG